MNTTASFPPTAARPAQFLRAAWAVNRPLVLFVLASVMILVVALVGVIIDPRAAGAAPGWVKPAKFAISLAIYAATFLWLLTFVQGYRRIVAVVATLTAVTSAIELGIIAMQVARGTYSHFNVGTPLDGMLFSIMGGAVVILWLMGLALGVLLLVQRLPNRTFAWGLRFGVFVTVAGMSVGFLMLRPTGDQLEQNATGRQSTLVGAHTIGAVDGGPGLPFVGWSTTNGDLRVAHFVGMHGMQIMPLLAFVLSHFAPLWMPVRHRVALVTISALGYFGMVALLTWQALRGQPLLGPDALTLAAAVGLVAAVGLAAGGVLVAARPGRLPADGLPDA